MPRIYDGPENVWIYLKICFFWISEKQAQDPGLLCSHDSTLLHQQNIRKTNKFKNIFLFCWTPVLMSN